MIGVVIVTHGNLAEELLATAEMIAGPMPKTKAVGVHPRDKMEYIREAIESAIKDVNEGQGVLVLTDMFGGTPCNVGLTFIEEGKVEVLSGVNLPMLLRLATGRTDTPGSLGEVARHLAIYGRRNIAPAGEMLRSRKPIEEEEK
jgi:PTS system mannose-specific IIA component